MPVPYPQPTPEPHAVAVDAVVFGGGIAGLWVLDHLHRNGLQALLLESIALGAGQSVCAQGIIHGGLKYTLSRAAGGTSTGPQPISAMPGQWRRFLAGDGSPDLRAARLLSDRCHLWQTRSMRSRLGMLGARAGLAVRPRILATSDRPPLLRSCPGTVAELAEPVVDPVSVLRALADHHRDVTLLIDSEHRLSVLRHDEARVEFEVTAPPTAGSKAPAPSMRIAAHHVILAAGAGNESLTQQFGLPLNTMQRRSLHMALARSNEETGLPSLYGHCVDGARTRVTVTTHFDRNGRSIWQIGGQVAEDGVSMSRAQLIGHAERELTASLPSEVTSRILSTLQWATYQIDRAEARQFDTARRPEDACLQQHGRVVLAWPTKFALAPRLAERVASIITAASHDAGPSTTGQRHDTPASIPDHWPRPDVADPPWETAIWS